MITRSRGISPQLHNQDHQLSAPIVFETHFSMLVCQKLVKPSFLLKSRLKLHIPLKIDELLCLQGSCLCLDFSFHELEIIRGSLMYWMPHTFRLDTPSIFLGEESDRR